MEKLTVEDGLSQGFIIDAVQTRDGFLWFATLDGLNRYDGISFEVFRPETAQPGLSRLGNMKRLLEDSGGGLWILFDRGLIFFDRRSERFFFIPEGLPGAYFGGICEDPTGNIWLNGQDRRLFRLRFTLGKARPADCLAGLRVDTFSFSGVDEQDTIQCLMPRPAAIWVGTRNGVFEVPYTGGGGVPVVGLPRIPVSGMWTDPNDGAVWLFSGARLFRYADGRVQTFQLDTEPDMRAQKGYTNGSVTLFVSKERVYRWRDGQLQRLPWEIPEGIVSACIDREGILWIGTAARGIRKIALDRFYFKRFGEGMSIGRQPIIDPAGRLFYIQAYPGPVDFRRYDLADGQYHGPFLPGKKAHFLIRSPSGPYWLLNTEPSLCRVERPGGAAECFALPRGEYSALEQDSQGRLLLGSIHNMLVRFDPVTGQYTTHSFAALLKPGETAPVHAISTDRKGRVWLGTAAGVLLATPGAGGNGYDFRRFTVQQPAGAGLTHNEVLSLLPDASDPDVCWAGTRHGLTRIDLGAGVFRQLRARDGLPNDVICSMLPGDENHIWLGTYNGLLELETRSFAWRHFSTADGLPCNEFNHRAAQRLADGRLFFGGVDGFTIFDPKATRAHSVQKPRLVFTALYVGHKKISPGDSTGILQTSLPYTTFLDLSYDNDDLIFHFALLDYFQSRANHYMYRLRGLNEEWINLGALPQVAFAHLAPGKYVLEVRARNKEGVFSAPAVISIQIRRPWWAGGWAFLVYFILLLAVLLIGRMVWLERVQIRRRLEAERLEAGRLKELEQFKSRLFSNYTHEFRTPLAIISSLAGQLRSLSKGAARKMVVDIEQQARDLLRLTGQILDLTKLDEKRLTLRPEPVELTDFLSGFCSGFKSLVDAKHITCSWDLPGEPVWVDADVSRLRDILYNLMSNAIKFTPEGGSVSLKLEPATSGEIIISVRDTGIGIAPEHLEKIFERHYQVAQEGQVIPGAGIGLSHAAELTRAMGGRITVESEPEKGSVFTLHLPVTPVASAAAKPARPKAGVLPVQLSYPEQPQVLILEDNMEIAKIVASYLSPDFGVDFAGDGRLGLEKAVEQLPDVILCDLRMPEMDGIAFCRALRANPQTSYIPVVILTAFTDEAVQLQAMQAGASAWLTKPVHPELLRRQLNSFLQLRKQLQVQLLQGIQEPAHPPAASESGSEEALVRQMMAVIAERFNDPQFSVPDLQQALSMSKSQLHRKLLSNTGRPAIWFIRRYRLDEAKKLLQTNRDITVAEVAYRVGFTDPNYFSRAFSTEFGQSPSAFREQNRSI